MKAVHKQVLTNAKEHMRRQKLKHTFDRIGSLYHDMKVHYLFDYRQGYSDLNIRTAQK